MAPTEEKKIEWLKLLGGLVALITAIIMLYVALKTIPKKSEKEPDTSKDDIEYLRVQNTIVHESLNYWTVPNSSKC